MRRKLEKAAFEKACKENWTEQEAAEYIRSASPEELKAYTEE